MSIAGGEGSATGGAVTVTGGKGGSTGGAVSVTSGVGTSDDSGSMTIATANSLFPVSAATWRDNRGVGLRGDGGVYGGDRQRDWRRGGAISLSVGGMATPAPAGR